MGDSYYRQNIKKKKKKAQNWKIFSAQNWKIFSRLKDAQ